MGLGNGVERIVTELFLSIPLTDAIFWSSTCSHETESKQINKQIGNTDNATQIS